MDWVVLFLARSSPLFLGFIRILAFAFFRISSIFTLEFQSVRLFETLGSAHLHSLPMDLRSYYHWLLLLAFSTP